MSRARRTKQDAAVTRGGPERGGAPEARRALGPLAIVVFAAVVAAAVFVGLDPGPRVEAERGAGDPGRAAAAIAGLDAEPAYRQALDLARRERVQESLPYFRRALAAYHEDFWQIHFDYASALYNLTRTYQLRRGLQVPALRSSYEQVQVMAESLYHLERAEQLAPSPDVLAAIEDRRAQMMAVWGFPWEAFLAYRQASTLDPAQEQFAERASQYAALMRAPNEVPRP